ncbi:glycosyltransferase [Labilibaculum euxinus]
MTTPFVSIKTITYNHEKFIAQCIEGIMMQKTNFPFEYIIGEDCSTDGTMKIVQEYADKYPDVIRIITDEKNVGAAANDHRTDLACKGKYVAFCEGDDFWTDPYKLQKQVDFLEANPDYGMVHTNFSCVKDGKIIKSLRGEEMLPTGDVLDDVLKGNHIATATVCMRNDLLQRINIGKKIVDEKWKMGDYPLWIETAAATKVRYMKDDTITYRIHDDSVTHKLDWNGDYRFFKDRYLIKKYYIGKFNREHLLPYILNIYHRELLKYAIFLKKEDLREECSTYFKEKAKGNEYLYRILSRYKMFDSIFCFLYTSRKKLKIIA